MKYDLDLFIELNKQYESKLLVATARSLKADSLAPQGEKSAMRLMEFCDLAGKRVLEVGCGRGHIASALARLSKAEVVAVDIRQYNEWQLWNEENLHFVKLDLTSQNFDSIGKFDFIYSTAVLEHVRHPYSMLKAIYDLLKPGALAHICANLHRGPKASHRYREVFFPWPHLLFEDSVFEEFYKSQGLRPNKPAWVNCLSVADYLRYFELIGFQTQRLWFWETKLDEELYMRFEDKLSRYPRFDLEKDFLLANLVRPK